jgi:hypothetical protein
MKSRKSQKMKKIIKKQLILVLCLLFLGMFNANADTINYYTLEEFNDFDTNSWLTAFAPPGGTLDPSYGSTSINNSISPT